MAVFHGNFKASARDGRLAALRATLAGQASLERDELSWILADFDRANLLARQLFHDAAHLPMTQSGVLSHEEAMAAQTIIRVIEAWRKGAVLLRDASVCRSNGCSEAHTSAHALVRVHEQARQTDLVDLIERASARVSKQLSSELDRLPGVLADLDQWRSAAAQVLRDVEHLPLTRTGALTEGEVEALRELTKIYDTNAQAARAFKPSQCEADGCAALHQPVATLCRYQAKAVASGAGELIVAVAERIAGQMQAERGHLAVALGDLDAWCSASAKALYDAEHMPLTRSRALSDSEQASMGAILELATLHGQQARALVDPNGCLAGTCQKSHLAGVLLARFHADGLRSGLGAEVVGAARRVAAQSLDERVRVARLHETVATWPGRVEKIRHEHAATTGFVRSRAAQFLGDSTGVRINRTAMRLFPLRDQDHMLAECLALLRDKPLLEADDRFLAETVNAATSVLSAVQTGFTPQWRCREGGECQRAHNLIPGVYGRADSIEDELARLSNEVADKPLGIDMLLEPSLRLLDWIPGDFDYPELLSAAITERARRNLTNVMNAASVAREAAAKAHAAADKVRLLDVANALRAMDLDALRKASPQDKFRVAPLEGRGLRNVLDVLEFRQKHNLEALEGIGQSSARAITQAALRLFEAVRDETPVRIDVRRKDKRTTTLLASLRRWDAARRFNPSKDELALAHALMAVFQGNVSADRVLAVTEGPVNSPPLLLGNLLTSALDRVVPATEDIDIWQDFLSRPADYFGLITELGFTTEDEKTMHGDLPEEIVEAVRAKELKRDFLTASLRTYQSFGARFALVQEKVVIGDEMGLGKTVEALAVLAHLRAVGRSHFLVVCPAAVMSNWIRETEKHTKMGAARLHGAPWERKQAAKSWIRRGGVAVTTYDMLTWAQEYINEVEVGCAVFDEAHYIKNPNTKRSLAASQVMGSLKHVVLMTGTPLENSVQEFRNLIGYIRPDLAESAPEFLASMFRKHMAPAYLRRNQEDVLTELPELVEIDEWMAMSDADERAYRNAVQHGHFMGMRRAAMLSERSFKVLRLIEIVEEARSNGRRVIVFSYFRDVLSTVARLLPGQVFGPLTGALPASERQSLVDRFSEAGHGAVLVAQITAGGIGLNIQSASVVVICEPQLKPTMESQAIARAHRMGQTNTVQVHRLLTENSVDERIREIVAEKKQLFDEFARDSVIAQQAPDAVDVSETELARIVIAAERERLFGQA
jgi:superfamily II DNA or RNA helicase